jgi:hypothetical protein
MTRFYARLWLAAALAAAALVAAACTRTEARAPAEPSYPVAELPFVENRPTLETAQALRDELLFQRAT